MFIFIKLIAFLVISIYIIILSRKSFRDLKSHGLYRFFTWELILILILYNIDFWFYKPFSPIHVISWIFLIYSIFPVIIGSRTLYKYGKPAAIRKDDKLVGMEKTTKLVTTGIYRYIRHPLYSSMFFATWGIFLKNISLVSLILAAASLVFIVITAKIEEKENIIFFGSEYEEYMKQTKMFIPFIY